MILIMDNDGGWHEVATVQKAKNYDPQGEHAYITEGKITVADAKHQSECVPSFSVWMEDIEGYLEDETGIVFENDPLKEDILTAALRDTLINYLKTHHPNRWVPENVREIDVE